MDQRTDTEHRLDAAPGHDIKPAIGEVRKARPWLDRMRQRRRQSMVITALIIAGIVATVAYWLNTSGYKSTDDAVVDACTVSISAQVGAAIVDVPVTDNQLVEAGAVLVRLDDRDFRAQVDQATAQVDQATANMANIDAQVAAQQARVDQAEKQTAQSQAALTFAQQQEKRYTTLVQKGAGRVEQAQQYGPICCRRKPIMRRRRPTRSPPKNSFPSSKRSAKLRKRNWNRRTPRKSGLTPISHAP